MSNAIAKFCVLLTICPNPVSAQDNVDAYVDRAANFMRQHCLDPMLERGQANAEGLTLDKENAQAAEYTSEGKFMTLTVVAPGQAVPPGCIAFVFTQAPEDSVEVADARAQALAQRMSGYIQNTVGPDVSDKLHDCAAWENSARFFRQPSLTAAEVSSDGARTVLVTGARKGAMVSVTAMNLGPLADCDRDGG